MSFENCMPMANKSIIRSRNKCDSYAWSWVIKQKSICMYTGICSYNRKILLVLDLQIHVYLYFRGKTGGEKGREIFSILQRTLFGIKRLNASEESNHLHWSRNTGTPLDILKNTTWQHLFWFGSEISTDHHLFASTGHNWWKLIDLHH